MEKSRKNVSKNSHRNFIKQGEGEGSKAVYKLYKKTGILVRDGFPKLFIKIAKTFEINGYF